MISIYQQGCIDVVVLDDRLTADEAEAVNQSLQGVLHKRLPQIIVDLRRVRFVDSCGLEILCDANDWCLRHGGMLRLAAPNGLIRDVLAITGLDESFEISENVMLASGAYAL